MGSSWLPTREPFYVFLHPFLDIFAQRNGKYLHASSSSRGLSCVAVCTSSSNHEALSSCIDRGPASVRNISALGNSDVLLVGRIPHSHEPFISGLDALASNRLHRYPGIDSGLILLGNICWISQFSSASLWILVHDWSPQHHQWCSGLTYKISRLEVSCTENFRIYRNSYVRTRSNYQWTVFVWMGSYVASIGDAVLVSGRRLLWNWRAFLRNEDAGKSLAGEI